LLAVGMNTEQPELTQDETQAEGGENRH
jgi:hypothetical protein